MNKKRIKSSEISSDIEMTAYDAKPKRQKMRVVKGKKLEQKIYYNHSDYIGGMRETKLEELLAKKPTDVITLAVKGMLPKGPLGRTMITKLHVYAGPEHNQEAQKPEVLTIKTRY